MLFYARFKFDTKYLEKNYVRIFTIKSLIMNRQRQGRIPVKKLYRESVFGNGITLVCLKIK